MHSFIIQATMYISASLGGVAQKKSSGFPTKAVYDEKGDALFPKSACHESACLKVVEGDRVKNLW